MAYNMQITQLPVTHNTYTTNFYIQIKNNPAVLIYCFSANHLQ